MSEYLIRRAEPTDKNGVMALLTQMFRGDVSGRYSWLYEGNPHGRAVTWPAMGAGDEPVGVTSIFPRRVLVDGRERIGSIGGDCYIDPSARRRGLATRLHAATMRGMTEAGVNFMFGPPLARNLGALKKAGSRAVGTLRRFTRPVTGDGVLRAVAHERADALSSVAPLLAAPMRLLEGVCSAWAVGLNLEEIESFGPEFEELARSVPRGVIRPLRDCAFLDWRYRQVAAPGKTAFAIRAGGRLVGFAALEVSGEVANVVDLFAPGLRVQRGALALLLKEARTRGCALVDIYRTAAGISRQALGLLGFVGREERIFQVMVPAGDPDEGLLVDPDAWHFTEGDKDSSTSFSQEPE